MASAKPVSQSLHQNRLSCMNNDSKEENLGKVEDKWERCMLAMSYIPELEPRDRTWNHIYPSSVLHGLR